MLTFKNTLLSYFLLVALIMVASRFMLVPVWIFIVLTIVLFAILFYGSYFINSNFYLDVICNATNIKNEVSLTFDDGPVEGNTDEILDILKENNVQATFFCIGKRITKNQSLVQRMDAEGHLIGNHSFSHHFFFDLYSLIQMKKEMNDTNTIIEKIINKKMNFFRPPYGVTTPVLAKAIKEIGVLPIGWNIRSMDTVIKNETKLVEKIKNRLKPGSVILLHDTSGVTVRSLQAIINEIKASGLKPVRLDHLLNLQAYD